MVCGLFRSSRPSLPQSNPSILLPCHMRAEYFLSKSYSSRIFFPSEVGPLVFWVCEAYHIFPFRHLWPMCRAPPSIPLPRSEICKDGLYTWENASLGGARDKRENPNKEFDIRNIRWAMGKISICGFLPFFFFIEFFSRANFRSRRTNLAAQIFRASAYLWLSIWIPSDICLFVIASIVNRRGIRFAMFRKAVV